MAIGTLGTTSTTALKKLPAWSQVVARADVASIGLSITDDSTIATILSGYGLGITAVLATGTTHTNTTLDTLVGTAGAPLTQIQVGDLCLKADVPLATFVQAVSGGGTTVTLSAAATGSNNQRTIFVRITDNPQIGLDDTGLLIIPKRGILKVLPGDFVGVDNTGWPILVSGASVGYAGSQWSSA